MRAKKVYSILFLLFINCFFFGCCSYNFCVKISNLSISNYSIASFTEVPPASGYSAVDYAIHIDFERDKRICQNKSFSNASLLATSCDDDDFFMENKVIHITIKSESDLSENFSAGSELKQLFKPRYINESYKEITQQTFLYLGQYLTEDDTESLEQIFNERIVIDEEYSLDRSRKLYYHDIIFNLETEEEIIPNDHIFTVGFLFMDQTFIELTTEEIHIY